MTTVEADGESDGIYNMGGGPLISMSEGLSTNDAAMRGNARMAAGLSGVDMSSMVVITVK